MANPSTLETNKALVRRHFADALHDPAVCDAIYSPTLAQAMKNGAEWLKSVRLSLDLCPEDGPMISRGATVAGVPPLAQICVDLERATYRGQGSGAGLCKRTRTAQ